LAFNTKEPMKQVEASNYKFRLNSKLTAEEIKMKVAESKQKRVLEK